MGEKRKSKAKETIQANMAGNYERKKKKTRAKKVAIQGYMSTEKGPQLQTVNTYIELCEAKE